MMLRAAPQSAQRLRRQPWAIALALAIALHVLVLYLGFAVPPMRPVMRGGGAFEEGGLSAHASGGIMVDLSTLPPAAQPAPEPKPEIKTVQDEETPAKETPAKETPDEPADKAEEPDVAEAKVPEPAAEPKADTIESAEAAALAEPPPAAHEAAAAKPELKPALPPRRVQLARRQPKPEPPPQPTPKVEPKLQQAAIPNAVTVAPSRLGTASGRVDGQIPNLTYRDRVLLWLKRHIYYPSEAYEFQQEGVVLVRFAINRRGQILYYNIDKSSGYYLLDQAVRIMMAQSSPVPPIPPSEHDDEMRFLVPVIFSKKLAP
jgi:protein TonB